MREPSQKLLFFLKCCRQVARSVQDAKHKNFVCHCREEDQVVAMYTAADIAA